MTDAGAAVLFDIDGTLIDSNYLHIQAWSEALERAGRPVDDWRIHRCIGMDSSKLLATLLGSEDDPLAEKAKNKHSRRYRRLASRLRTFHGARELLAAVRDRGLTVVLATSATPDELSLLLETLDADDIVDVTTSGEDVDTAKPAPDLVQVALERVGLPAERAILVGDTVWDAAAAEKAGVRFIGVRSGGISAEELINAGAVAVYTDVAHLLDELDISPIATLRAGVSPTDTALKATFSGSDPRR